MSTEFPDDAGDGDDGAPTTLPLGQVPSPSRPGTKYPVWESLTSVNALGIVTNLKNKYAMG